MATGTHLVASKLIGFATKPAFGNERMSFWDDRLCVGLITFSIVRVCFGLG
ncbi:hypothetical protein ACLQ25_31680 [Micromonospora sp. DT44]|uniref:hypothetical protein n=1 Tax=Micromonospora sp. DT44 TaxID=3393439 RepID=UPI003CF7CAB1